MTGCLRSGRCCRVLLVILGSYQTQNVYGKTAIACNAFWSLRLKDMGGGEEKQIKLTNGHPWFHKGNVKLCHQQSYNLSSIYSSGSFNPRVEALRLNSGGGEELSSWRLLFESIRNCLFLSNTLKLNMMRQASFELCGSTVQPQQPTESVFPFLNMWVWLTNRWKTNMVAGVGIYIFR